MWEPQYSWTGRGLISPPPPPALRRRVELGEAGGADGATAGAAGPAEHAFAASTTIFQPIAPLPPPMVTTKHAPERDSPLQLVVRVDPAAGGIRGVAVPAVRPASGGPLPPPRRPTSSPSSRLALPELRPGSSGMAGSSEHQKARHDIRASVAALDSLDNSISVIRSEVDRLSAAGLSLFDGAPDAREDGAARAAGGIAGACEQEQEDAEWERWLKATYPKVMRAGT